MRRRPTVTACLGRRAGLSPRGCFGTRLLLFLALLAGIAFPANAQTQTAVSGTVTDPHGLVYAGATISWKLVTSGGGTPSLTPCNNPGAGCQIAAAGGPFPLAPTSTISGTGLAAPPAGSFSMSLWANASILPAGSTYSFFVSIPGVLPPWGTGAQSCSVTGVTIAGATQDIGAALSAVCPPLTPPFGGGTPGSIVCSPGPCQNNFFSVFDVVGGVTNLTNGPCVVNAGVMVCSTPLDVQNNGYGIEKANSASGTTCGLSVTYDAAGNAIVTPNGATSGIRGRGRHHATGRQRQRADRAMRHQRPGVYRPARQFLAHLRQSDGDPRFRDHRRQWAISRCRRRATNRRTGARARHQPKCRRGNECQRGYFYWRFRGQQFGAERHGSAR